MHFNQRETVNSDQIGRKPVQVKRKRLKVLILEKSYSYHKSLTDAAAVPFTIPGGIEMGNSINLIYSNDGSLMMGTFHRVLDCIVAYTVVIMKGG